MGIDSRFRGNDGDVTLRLAQGERRNITRFQRR
jgi:hypothetical protein